MNSGHPIINFFPDVPSGAGGKETNTVLMNTPFGGIENIREIYFIGIGGIGMSALYKTLSKKIPGYPKVDMNDITKSMTGLRISNVIDN